MPSMKTRRAAGATSTPTARAKRLQASSSGYSPSALRAAMAFSICSSMWSRYSLASSKE